MTMTNVPSQRHLRRLQAKRLDIVLSFHSQRDTYARLHRAVADTRLFTLVPSTDLCMRLTFPRFFLIHIFYTVIYDIRCNE